MFSPSKSSEAPVVKDLPAALHRQSLIKVKEFFGVQVSVLQLLAGISCEVLLCGILEREAFG